MYITPTQIRAARAILKWTQGELAERASVNINSIKNIEAETTQPRPKMIESLQQVFEHAGLKFLPHNGVCRDDNKIRIFEDGKGYTAFYQDILDAVEKRDSDILVNGVDEELFEHQLPGCEDKYYILRMTDIQSSRNKQHIKSIICEGDNNHLGYSYSEYRSVPKDIFPAITSYTYENKVAIFLWNNPAKIILVEDIDLAKTFRMQFQLHWEKSTPVPKNYRNK